MPYLVWKFGDSAAHPNILGERWPALHKALDALDHRGDALPHPDAIDIQRSRGAHQARRRADLLPWWRIRRHSEIRLDLREQVIHLERLGDEAVGARFSRDPYGILTRGQDKHGMDRVASAPFSRLQISLPLHPDIPISSRMRSG